MTTTPCIHANRKHIVEGHNPQGAFERSIFSTCAEAEAYAARKAAQFDWNFTIRVR